MDNQICSKCGETGYSINYFESIKIEMLDRCLCYSCNFWTSKMEYKDQSDIVIANGGMFRIGPEGEKFKGCSGKKYNIEFFDGRKVTTTNLWCNGAIPDNFKSDLPDNAKFI